VLALILEGTMRRIGIIALTAALLCVGRIEAPQAADHAPSIIVLAKTTDADATVTEHRDGEAVPLGARYRVQIESLEGGALTVTVVLPGGTEKPLFSGDLPAGSNLDLPQGGGWYDLPREPGDIKLESTQNSATTQHLLHAIDASPNGDGEQWKQKTGDGGPSSPLTSSKYPPLENSAELSRQVSAYTKLAFALASAREPILRGGVGARIFREAGPGVVLVVVDDGLGSGIILNQAGQILTNWHVIRGAKNIGVMLKPPAGQQLRPTDMYEAHLNKYDEVADLAVIEIDHAPPNLLILRLGDERSVETGSTVHAIGHPSGDYWTYTAGVISQVRADYEWTGEDKLQHTATVIQTQTPINPGNSGGPLLDDGPNVIGINSFSEAGKQGLNFAISVGDVKRFLSAGGNRLAQLAPDTNRTHKPPSPEGCESRRYQSFIDQKTKKVVTPIDTKCSGRPNLYIVGERADKSPEYALVDNVGDGKFDAKVVFAFDGKADLWIFYAKRNGVPTAFGYDHEGKGKPDLVVAVSAVPQ
jgi:S1-C subfamily serine protease